MKNVTLESWAGIVSAATEHEKPWPAKANTVAQILEGKDPDEIQSQERLLGPACSRSTYLRKEQPTIARSPTTRWWAIEGASTRASTPGA